MTGLMLHNLREQKKPVYVLINGNPVGFTEAQASKEVAPEACTGGKALVPKVWTIACIALIICLIVARRCALENAN